MFPLILTVAVSIRGKLTVAVSIRGNMLVYHHGDTSGRSQAFLQKTAGTPPPPKKKKKKKSRSCLRV